MCPDFGENVKEVREEEARKMPETERGHARKVEGRTN